MKIISLGLGVQSTALYFMSSMELIEKADYAIFADPGAESNETSEYLKFLLESERNNNGIKILVESNKNIYEDILNDFKNGKKFVTIPAHSVNENGKKSILRRQCTGDYKIKQVYKSIRNIYGLRPYQRYPSTEIWLGITLDEAQRAKDSREKWATNVYPFLNLPTDFFPNPWSRGDCINFYKQHELPIPPKSSCVFCPYQSPMRWAKVMENPIEREKVINIDRAIRNMSMKGESAPIYLTRHCMPIDQITFENSSQDEFGNECEGHCGL